jgi:Spy/CpxP family protein refolding chaperone
MERRAGLMAAIVMLGISCSLAQPGTGTGAPGQDAAKGRMRQDAVRGQFIGQFMRERAAMAEKLNLTDQQKKDMQKLRIEMEKKNTPLASQIRLARLEIQQLMLSDNPDKAKIEKQMKEVSDLELKMKLNGLDHAFAMKNILTPEQQKIWRENRGGFGWIGGPAGRGEQRHIRIFRNGPMWGDLDPIDEFDEQIDVPIDLEEEIETN